MRVQIKLPHLPHIYWDIYFDTYKFINIVY